MEAESEPVRFNDERAMLRSTKQEWFGRRTGRRGEAEWGLDTKRAREVNLR